jgi:hypothetical protein
VTSAPTYLWRVARGKATRHLAIIRFTWKRASLHPHIPFNTPPVFLPDAVVLLPPVAHEIAADMDASAALVACNKVMPADIEQPNRVSMSIKWQLAGSMMLKAIRYSQVQGSKRATSP